MRLKDKTVIVTGAGSGIGLETCRKILKEGGRVVAVDRDEQGLSALGDALRDTGDAFLSVAGDVVDPTTIERAVASAENIQGLVTAAGISESGTPLTDIAPEAWDRVFEVNVKASWLWLKAVVPGMRAQGGGSVVMIASQLAFGGGQLNAAYIASKGAIVSLVKTTALELAEDGIRVNAVAPGAIDTPMLRRSMSRAADPEAARERSRSRHAMGRFGKPEEMANGIAFLLSDESSFSTGSTLLLDGGWTAA